MELPTYFILPLTRLNFKSFGKFGTNWNVKNTKIDLQEKKIHVKVYKIELIYADVVNNENFVKIIKPDEIILNIPDTINSTLKFFSKGQYSRFPETIKQWIRSYSGLPEGHNYLLALDKDEKVRKELEISLKVCLPLDAELLEAPKEEWFIVKEEERV